MRAKQTTTASSRTKNRPAAQPLMEPLEGRQMLALGVADAPSIDLAYNGTQTTVRHRSSDYVMPLGGRTSSISGPGAVPPVDSVPIGAGQTDDAGQPEGAVSNPDFVLFDGALFTGKPNLAAVGMPRAYVTGLDMWAGTYPNFDMTKPDETACRALARRTAGLNQMLVLDVEHWSVNLMTTPQEEVDQNLAKLAQMVDWIKDERPNLKVGFYGLLPISDYWITARYASALQNVGKSAWWDAIMPSARANYQAMQRANDYIAAVLAPRVDFVSPSFYTFYDDPVGWELVSTMRIEESRRFGKPVLPFLMMEYHEGGPARKEQVFLSADFWQRQLQTVYAHADGAVVWGGYQKLWDEQAPWWQVTREWLADVQP